VAEPPLAVDAGLIVPHDEPPQVAFQTTPALLLSLLTVAMRPVLVPTLSDVTGALRKETDIGLAGGFDPVPLLQATTNRAIAEAKKTLIALRNFTGLPRSG
jgi:hypothetical protein